MVIRFCRVRSDHCCRFVQQPLEVMILFAVRSVGFNDGVGHKVNMLPFFVKVVLIRSILWRDKGLFPVHVVTAGFGL